MVRMSALGVQWSAEWPSPAGDPLHRGPRI